MKITKSRFRRILREEYLKLLQEQSYAKQGQTASDLASYGFKPGEKEQLSDIERLNLQTAEEPLSQMSAGGAHREDTTWVGSPEEQEEWESFSKMTVGDPEETGSFGEKEPDEYISVEPLGIEWFEPTPANQRRRFEIHPIYGPRRGGGMVKHPDDPKTRRLAESKSKK